MRLIRFQIDEHPVTFGCLEGDDVHLLEGDPLQRPAPGKFVAPLSNVRLCAPCVPGKVIAMAINFPGIDGYSPEMTEPMVFVKPRSSVIGPMEPVINPFPELPWWGEAELAVVIGRHLRNASVEETRDAALGFTIGNDVTVENVEHRDHHLARSKCPDTFCPLGPWIDTDYDPTGALVEAIQNGEMIRSGNASDHHWRWDRIVSWISSWMTLDPWDVVLTGNPPDTVGMRFVSHGDTYTARVSGLGELTNPFYVGEVPPNV